MDRAAASGAAGAGSNPAGRVLNKWKLCEHKSCKMPEIQNKYKVILNEKLSPRNIGAWPLMLLIWLPSQARPICPYTYR